jgi:hypothetical protein
MLRPLCRLAGLLLPILWMLPAPVLAAAGDAQLADDDRIAELERKVEVLTDELERTRTALAVPDQAPLESSFGLGPAASKVYNRAASGLSLGGYAEGAYTAYIAAKGSSQNEIDLLRLVLYAGYKFTDRIVFNSEIEFEHGGEEVGVEFATLDFLMADWANARVGVMLIPMGFVNQIHEPPFYFGTHRPELERRILPTTWSEAGVGLFGSLLSDTLSYKLYLVNGFDASGFSAGGLRGGRQNGSEALAENFAFVGRVDWNPTPDLLIGASGYVGNAGQNQVAPAPPMGTGLSLPDALTSIWEAHAEYQRRGLHLRGLFAQAMVDQADLLNAAIGNAPGGSGVASEMLGAYGEIAYEVLQWVAPNTQMTLEPFYRFEWVDTQQRAARGYVRDESQRNYIHTAGVSFKPIRNVVIKLDYRNISADAGTPADELNLGVGLVF